MVIERVSRHQMPLTYVDEQQDHYLPPPKKQPGWDGVDRLTSATQNQMMELLPPHVSNYRGSAEERNKVIGAHQLLLNCQHLLGNLIEATKDNSEVDFNLLDARSRETLIELFLITCRKSQIENVEENGVVLEGLIKSNQKATKEIRELYFNALDDQIKKVSDEKKMETATTILNALTISGALLTLTCTLVTGNVPAALIILNGAVAIVSGGMSIAQAELEKQSQKLTALLLELTNKRELLGQKMSKEHLREMKIVLDTVLNLYSQQRTILDQQLDAGRLNNR